MGDINVEMPTYKIEIRKQIHAGFSAAQTGDVCVGRYMDLPFPPFVGLVIQDGEWCSDSIIEICYDVERDRFTCYIEADKELYHAECNGKKKRPIAEIVKEYVVDGGGTLVS